jgi:Crp-like helix-turn-helix domain
MKSLNTVMYSLHSPLYLHESAVRWQQVCDWAKQEGRYQEFQKDEEIPSKNGWFHGIQRGIVRLNGRSINSIDSTAKQQVNFLGLVVKHQPFEVTRDRHTTMQAVAHVANTGVFWLRWDDLDMFPGFDRDVLNAFRYQNQRKTMLMNTLSQNHATDRLLGYLSLLMEEFGEVDGQSQQLPFVLTHHQLANAIGATRVTVTRLLGELRDRGAIKFSQGNRIVIPQTHASLPHLRLVE